MAAGAPVIAYGVGGLLGCCSPARAPLGAASAAPGRSPQACASGLSDRSGGRASRWIFNLCIGQSATGTLALASLPTPLPQLGAETLSAQRLIGLQSWRSRLVKRSGDLVFSLAVLCLGAPLFLLLGLMVKLTSRGPVFYVQQRVGRDYRSFGCIKFRTMRRDADHALGLLLAQSPDLAEEFRNDYKLKNDPRITPLGKFLRRSSLDELPQFWNVLKGEMSVVGPRPIVRDELERYGDCMEEVLAVRPGLTGLWQVSGRNNLAYSTRVRLDLRYARYRDFWLDIRIILRTIAVILVPKDRGAY